MEITLTDGKKEVTPPADLSPPALHGHWVCNDPECKNFDGQQHYRWPAKGGKFVEARAKQ